MGNHTSSRKGGGGRKEKEKEKEEEDIIPMGLTTNRARGCDVIWVLSAPRATNLFLYRKGKGEGGE